MRYIIGIILLILGVTHGIHTLNIEYGTVLNLNNARFLSFPSLDRITSSGIFGKYFILLIDTALIALGVSEIKIALVYKKLKDKKV